MNETGKPGVFVCSCANIRPNLSAAPNEKINIVIIDNRYLFAVSQYIVKAIKVLADGLY